MYIFSCLITYTIMFKTMLNNNDDTEHICPVPDLIGVFIGNSYSIFKLIMWSFISFFIVLMEWILSSTFLVLNECCILEDTGLFQCSLLIYCWILFANICVEFLHLYTQGYWSTLLSLPPFLTFSLPAFCFKVVLDSGNELREISIFFMIRRDYIVKYRWYYFPLHRFFCCHEIISLFMPFKVLGLHLSFIWHSYHHPSFDSIYLFTSFSFQILCYSLF